MRDLFKQDLPRHLLILVFIMQEAIILIPTFRHLVIIIMQPIVLPHVDQYELPVLVTIVHPFS